MSTSKSPSGLWDPLSKQDLYRLDSLGDPNNVLDPYPPYEKDFTRAFLAIESDQTGGEPTCDVEKLLSTAIEMTERFYDGDPTESIRAFHCWGRAFYAHQQIANGHRAFQLAKITALRWADHQALNEAGTINAVPEEA